MVNKPTEQDLSLFVDQIEHIKKTPEYWHKKGGLPISRNFAISIMEKKVKMCAGIDGLMCKQLSDRNMWAGVQDGDLESFEIKEDPTYKDFQYWHGGHMKFGSLVSIDCKKPFGLMMAKYEKYPVNCYLLQHVCAQALAMPVVKLHLIAIYANPKFEENVPTKEKEKINFLNSELSKYGYSLAITIY